MEGMYNKSPSLNSPLSFGRVDRFWANRKDFSGSVFTDCAALYSGECKQDKAFTHMYWWFQTTNDRYKWLRNLV